MNTFSKLALIAAIALPLQFSSAQVVINEVFAGGGNAGPPAAPFNQDYVEIFNTGGTAIDISGWTLSYATSGSATYNSIITFGAGTFLGAGQSFLITASNVGATGSAVPNVTHTGTAVNFANAGGKIQLVNAGATRVDFVGWGTANEFEGAGAAPAMTNANSIQRTGGVDTNNNAMDFTALAPTPVPEPGTYMLLGIGALLCVQRFRRSRNK